MHFLDGERPDALNEWATLQNDANARARLTGLRSALRFNIDLLKKYQEEGSRNFPTLYIHGIELYLSEPVICDEPFINQMFQVWAVLREMEELRKILSRYPKDSAALKEQLPTMEHAAKSALRASSVFYQQVEAAIEKMKPLGE